MRLIYAGICATVVCFALSNSADAGTVTWTTGATVTLAEDTTDSPLLTLAATTDAGTDPDNHVNDFALEGTSTTFDVATNGEITLKTGQTLDYETAQSYIIVVKATASAQDTATLSLTISITDVNDSPTFSTASAAVSLCSNIKSGRVGTYAATDEDKTAPNNALSYTIHDGDDDSPNAKFSIAAGGGVSKTDVAFDTGVKSSYTLVIFAADGGTTSLTASTTVTATVVTCSGTPALTSGTFVAIATVLLAVCAKMF